MKNIDEQISINSDISTLDKSSDISNLKNDLLINNNPLVNKDKIERLKRVKKEIIGAWHTDLSTLLVGIICLSPL